MDFEKIVPGLWTSPSVPSKSILQHSRWIRASQLRSSGCAGKLEAAGTTGLIGSSCSSSVLFYWCVHSALRVVENIINSWFPCRFGGWWVYISFRVIESLHFECGQSQDITDPILLTNAICCTRYIWGHSQKMLFLPSNDFICSAIPIYSIFVMWVGSSKPWHNLKLANELD